jgi:hypothetical protein
MGVLLLGRAWSAAITGAALSEAVLESLKAEREPCRVRARRDGGSQVRQGGALNAVS